MLCLIMYLQFKNKPIWVVDDGSVVVGDATIKSIGHNKDNMIHK